MAEYLIITGLSGAGRSTAAATLEDLGWLVIDNLPPSLIPQVSEMTLTGGQTEKVALVSGRGGTSYVEELTAAIEGLRQAGKRVRVLFLEASDEVLVRRYENTRRRHPLAEGEGILEGIQRERALLEAVKSEADVVVDTSDFNVHQLRDRLLELFARDAGLGMQTSIVSFGYKHGLPLDVDLVFDCRFLPNPHWVEELRELTGLDRDVVEYVESSDGLQDFYDRVLPLLDYLLPAYVREGKQHLTVGIGCTGGRHRSVVIAEHLARIYAARGDLLVDVVHRDVDKPPRRP